MGAEARVERLEPYLRPNQINDLVDEKKGIEGTLHAPSYVSNQLQDRGAMIRQARAIDKQLFDNSPRPYVETEIDPAVRREGELRERLSSTMLTQAEMRRNPYGATDKLRAWEGKYKQDVLEWKNLRLRLHVSGLIDEHPDAREVANLEQFRPAYSPQELTMRGEQIQGKQMFLPPGPIEAKNVMSVSDRVDMIERDRLAAEAADAALSGKIPSRKS